MMTGSSPIKIGFPCFHIIHHPAALHTTPPMSCFLSLFLVTFLLLYLVSRPIHAIPTSFPLSISISHAIVFLFLRHIYRALSDNHQLKYVRPRFLPLLSRNTALSNALALFIISLFIRFHFLVGSLLTFFSRHRPPPTHTLTVPFSLSPPANRNSFLPVSRLRHSLFFNYRLSLLQSWFSGFTTLFRAIFVWSIRGVCTLIPLFFVSSRAVL